MKKDIENKLQKDMDRRMKALPFFISEFIYYNEARITIKTKIAYLKDLDVFLEYISIIFREEKRNITLQHIQKLTEMDIREFIYSFLIDYNKKYNTKNGKEVCKNYSNSRSGQSRKLSTLRTFYKYLVSNKIVNEDITKNIEVVIKKPKGIKNTLSQEELHLLYEAIIYDKNIENNRSLIFHQRTKLRDYVIVLLLSYTGIRISELVQLDIQDINIESKMLTISRKGNVPDTVYLPEKILLDINDYLEHRKLVLDINVQYKDALFLSIQKKRMTPRAILYMLNKYAKRTGITQNVTPHVFRRTYAVALLEQTNDIESVRKVLGHSSADTTQRYAQASEKRKKEVMSNFKYDLETPEEDLKSNLKELLEKAKELGIDLNQFM